MDRIGRNRAITWSPPAEAIERRRILFLSCHLPWPPVSGGRRRELELIQRLAASFDIHLVVVSKTAEQDEENVHRLNGTCHTVEVFAAEPLTATATRDQPIQLARHHAPDAARRVAEILDDGQVDAVHVEGYYLMQHVPDSCDVPVLLVEQNIEYDLEHQRAIVNGNAETRFGLFSRCLRTRAAEFEAWCAATKLATVTEEDRDVIRGELPRAEVSIVPDGSDHLPRVGAGNMAGVDRPDAPLIVLLANFAYGPNVDAAQYLCGEIIPALRATVPDVHAWLVGNAPPPEVQALGSEKVTIVGRVPDVVPYLDAADVLVCPLRIGGGIKVKTIEGLRRGKAIVSTSIGAQGLDAQARQALVIADEPRAFADGVATLVQDRDRRAQLERRALRAAARLPTWDDAANALAAVYDELLDRAPRTKAEPVRIAAGRSL